MVDAVVSVLLDKLVTLLISEGRQLLLVQDQFEETKNELRYMQSYLKEANRVKGKDKKDVLKLITSDLRELVYDVEDIVADCQLLLLEQNGPNSSSLLRNFSPRFLQLRREVGKRLHKVNLSIGKVKERMRTYLSTAPSRASRDHEPTDQPLSNPVLMNENELVGLEDDSAKIRGWILEENQPFMVIGIVGMGGIGKTTLAEKVCKSAIINSHFKHSLLVSVSQAFKLIDLLKRMLTKLKVAEEFIRERDVDDLLERLRSELDDRYLLVLDDVWGTDEAMWWESLKSALPRRSGCCILVTTRNKEVAISMGAMERHIHWPITLSNEESWSLFSKVAFVREGSECINHDLEGIGKEIVARCGGLPLAIKIVGGMMSAKGSSIHEWRRISKHLKEEMSDKKKDELVISKLQLSYEELPSYLKPCFLCFAMYPEDFLIARDEIIYGWIGEGLVWGSNGKTAYEIGERCLAELLRRCLILGEDKDIFYRTFEYSYKMHDMVRDMVIKIAREENFMCVDEKGRPTLSVQSRRIGIIRSSFTETFQSNTNLRALVWTDIESKEIIMNIRRNICNLRWLRVLYLSFSRTSIDNVPAVDWLSGIGSLPHLVYLTIGNSAVKKLPDSIGNLRKLQIFRLFNCPNLEGLPATISNLGKLTTLLTVDCPLEFIPEGLGKLSNLENLSMFNLPTNPKYKTSFRMGQLKNLTQLREIRMYISSKDLFEEGGLNILRKLPWLKLLLISCEGNDGSIEFIEKLHRPLSPLESLQELKLVGFPSKETPPWLNPTTLPNLQHLFICRWGNLTEMGPKLYEMKWKVEVLVLWFLHEVEVDWARIQKAMPMLRLVEIIFCPKMESFDLCVDGEGNGEWRKEGHSRWRRHY